MYYPERLPDHNKLDWSHQDFFSSEELCYVTAAVMSEHAFYMHRHQFYEINVIAQGTGRHYIENRSYDAPVGCVFPLPPGIRHGYYSHEVIHAYHIMLHRAFFEQYARELKNLPGYTLLFEIEPYLRREAGHPLFLTLEGDKMVSFREEMHKLLDLCGMQIGGIQVLKNIEALQIIAMLSRWISSHHHLDERTRDRKYSLEIVRSMEYIQMHFTEKLSIDFLARQANLSRSTYLQYFQEICRCTPAKYQLTCRLKLAKKYLRFTAMTVTEIAQECGFYDSSHFIRCFEQSEGLRPMAYRAQLEKP